MEIYCSAFHQFIFIYFQRPLPSDKSTRNDPVVSRNSSASKDVPMGQRARSRVLKSALANHPAISNMKKFYGRMIEFREELLNLLEMKDIFKVEESLLQNITFQKVNKTSKVLQNRFVCYSYIYTTHEMLNMIILISL